MSVSSISQANGADLLNLYAQSTGKAPVSPVTASTDVLKKALAEAQQSASEVLAGGDNTSGSQLNVYA